MEYAYEDENSEYVVINNESDSETERSSHFKSKIKSERSNNWPTTTSPRNITYQTGGGNNSIHSVESAPQIFTTQSIVPDDECDIFGKHVAVELRHLDDVYTKQNAKMKISTILYEARLSLLNRQNQQRQDAQDNIQPYIVLDQSANTTSVSQQM